MLGGNLLDAVTTPLWRLTDQFQLKTAGAASSSSTVQFIDVAEKAGLTAPNVWGGVESKRVITDHGVISAGLVIVAVDGRLDALLPQLADRVRTARLQMLATSPRPARLPCPVYGRWGYDYAQQDAAGRIYAGGGRDHFVDDEWTTSTTPTAPVQAWIESVAERMAGGRVGVTHRWAASVGYTADGRPLCVETAPGVFAIGGYSGTGNLVGPVMARAAVALALDGTPPPRWCAT